MKYVIFSAMLIGLVLGLFIGYRLSKLLSIWFSRFARAPLLVENCSLVVARLFLIFSLPLSAYVGGMLGGGLLGGGWGSPSDDSISIRTFSIPVGIALGIAITYTSSIVIGATIGGLIGKLLSRILPKAVVTWLLSGG